MGTDKPGWCYAGNGQLRYMGIDRLPPVRRGGPSRDKSRCAEQPPRRHQEACTFSFNDMKETNQPCTQFAGSAQWF